MTIVGALRDKNKGKYIIFQEDEGVCDDTIEYAPSLAGAQKRAIALSKTLGGAWSIYERKGRFAPSTPVWEEDNG